MVLIVIQHKIISQNQSMLITWLDFYLFYRLYAYISFDWKYILRKVFHQGTFALSVRTFILKG